MIARLMGLRTVSPADLERRLREGSVAIFDVNAAESWRSAHVAGARHLDPMGFAPADQDASSSSTARAPRKAPNAALRARRMGYPNVHVLSAGISGWIGAGRTTESEESVSARKSW